MVIAVTVVAEPRWPWQWDFQDRARVHRQARDQRLRHYMSDSPFSGVNLHDTPSAIQRQQLLLDVDCFVHCSDFLTGIVQPPRAK
jgi:hypothetical protein